MPAARSSSADFDMQAEASHTDRITDLISRLNETTTRFASRIERAGARAEQATTGWTPAQVAAHLALVNQSLASVIDGSVPGATPPAADFRERPWSEVVRLAPPRNEAPARFVPPTDVTAPEALKQFRMSAARLQNALAELPEERGGYCFTNRIFGTITLYQAGEFAIAHMIRHNQQAKRILGD